MPEFQQQPDGRYRPWSMIDLRNDRRTRSAVFVLRLISVVFFVSIFGGIPMVLRAGGDFDPVFLWDFGLERVPALLSFPALAVALFAVAVAHEMLHAAVLHLSGVADVKFEVNGIVPRVYATDWYIRRGTFFFYAFLPFFVLSTVGVVLLLLVETSLVAWVFIPVVANAVLSASDFTVIAWSTSVPPDGLIEITREGSISYAPGSASDGNDEK